MLADCFSASKETLGKKDFFCFPVRNVKLVDVSCLSRMAKSLAQHFCVSSSWGFHLCALEWLKAMLQNGFVTGALVLRVLLTLSLVWLCGL